MLKKYFALHELVDGMNEILLSNDLFRTGLLIMDYLHEHREANMTDLKKFSKVSYSRVTRVGDHLVKLGYCTRKNSKRDRRSWILVIRPKGEKFLAEITEKLQAFYDNSKDKIAIITE